MGVIPVLLGSCPTWETTPLGMGVLAGLVPGCLGSQVLVVMGPKSVVGKEGNDVRNPKITNKKLASQ